METYAIRDLNTSTAFEASSELRELWRLDHMRTNLYYTRGILLAELSKRKQRYLQSSSMERQTQRQFEVVSAQTNLDQINDLIAKIGNKIRDLNATIHQTLNPNEQ